LKNAGLLNWARPISHQSRIECVAVAAKRVSCTSGSLIAELIVTSGWTLGTAVIYEHRDCLRLITSIASYSGSEGILKQYIYEAKTSELPN
jgi:hypothetical protein